MSKSFVKDKSYTFALRVLRLYRYLLKRKEYDLARQVLRAGTSIGANVEEAVVAQSRADFLAKMSIASKEARETGYWLRLLRDDKVVAASRITELLKEAEALSKILVSIVKTTSESLNGGNRNAKTKNSKLKIQTSKLHGQSH